MRRWFRGWYVTLKLMLVERGLYQELLDSKNAPLGDFVDAPPPETYR